MITSGDVGLLILVFLVGIVGTFAWLFFASGLIQSVVWVIKKIFPKG